MTFEVGSLVRARGREWVVLPETVGELDTLVVRPLGGTDDEITGISTTLEKVESAKFPFPDTSGDLGNHVSCGLLRDAVRLGFRSAAGPFRSLARIAVEPRPYQLVPLLMALKQDPVRLLVADDVGVGKTVEALLIARELLDRGEVRRMAVLCPPHLAEQWQRAMRDQFHIDAALVLASTAARLEREADTGRGESLFDRYPFVVVSLDYIKQQRRFDTFVRACPELVIVDEAHTCTDAGPARSAAQQRHALLKKLVANDAPGKERHLVLVTATPHSGNPENFRSLLSLLDPSFQTMPEDLAGDANRRHRERLAQHVVQRKRGDVTHYPILIDGETSETPFPVREQADATYLLGPEYTAFFKKLVAFCRERVLDTTLKTQRQRVRWWSALALLRSVGSSPAAAAATLRNRAQSDTAETVDEADELGRRSVLDLDEESAEGIDVVHGAQEGEDAQSADTRALRALAKEADELRGPAKDTKLKQSLKIIEDVLKAGYSPIVFCRFIPTVEYLVEELRKKLKGGVVVEGVTGGLPPEEREARVEALRLNAKRVLVCTDCLSEGINLQHAFDAVIHYDLSWNPTRHEQREGRVDRYGQEKKTVRAVTYYGDDNPIDILVRKKLIEKHKAILKQLGVYVPVPQNSDRLVETLMKEVFFAPRSPFGQGQLSLDLEWKGQQLGLAIDDVRVPEADELELQWDRAVEREKKSRALFAQHSMKTEEVAAEVASARRALGGEADVQRFVLTACGALGATISSSGPPFDIDLRETPAAVRDAIDEEEKVRVDFRGQGRDGVTVLGRTHPIVSGLASYVLETALDTKAISPARRCGVVRTAEVTKRTTVLLVRARYHLVIQRPDAGPQPLLAEDVLVAGFEGSPEEPIWLDDAAVEKLLGAKPSANTPHDLARAQLDSILARFSAVEGHLAHLATERGNALLAAHRRVRDATKARTKTLRVEPHLPADVLGVFVYLPAGGAS